MSDGGRIIWYMTANGGVMRSWCAGRRRTSAVHLSLLSPLLMVNTHLYFLLAIGHLPFGRTKRRRKNWISLDLYIICPSMNWIPFYNITHKSNELCDPAPTISHRRFWVFPDFDSWEKLNDICERRRQLWGRSWVGPSLSQWSNCHHDLCNPYL